MIFSKVTFDYASIASDNCGQMVNYYKLYKKVILKHQIRQNQAAS